MSGWLQRSFQRLWSVFRRSQDDSELDRELASHLELAVEENLQRGMPPDEARRQAFIQIGGMEQARELQREARSLPALETFFQDLRYAFRGLITSPGFAVAAVLTLAMGIGINATMFSMVSSFLLRRPPVPDPERVVVISSVNPAGGPLSDINSVSAPNYLSWRTASNVFERMAAADEGRIDNLTVHGKTEALVAAAVTSDYFPALGVAPQIGRGFSDAETQPGRDHVVIISHELWVRDFGADPELIGRTVRLNREDYAVIGIMPANFRLMGFIAQLWTPLVFTEADQAPAAHSNRLLSVFARLKPGVSLDQARAELNTLALRTQDDFPASEKGWGIGARTLPDFLIYSFGIRSALVIVMIVVGFVLLIACANVAGLLLARAGARRKELAIRMSLGAGRLRIIRQLLTEGLMIALLGGGLGLVLSYWGIKIVRLNMNFNPGVSAIAFNLDWNVVLYAMVISLFSAVVCSLAPALTASRADFNVNLKDESRAATAGRSHNRLRKLLVTSEIAVALFLLIGTGLLLRGVFVMMHQDLGFDHERLLTAGVTLDKARYKETSQQALFVQNLTRLLQQLPGVQGVAAGSDLPATWSNNIAFRIKGEPELPANRLPTAYDVVATADYFQVAGIPLLRGRLFTPSDDASAAPIVVVNEKFVRRYFKGQDAIGKQVHLEVNGSSQEWREIVGVVGDVKTFSQSMQTDPQVYEPFLQRPVPSFSLMLRTSSDPNSLAPALRKAVAQVDPELPLFQVLSMPSLIEFQTGGSNFFLEMLGTFALLALILSAVGVYGLLAYSVGQRRHEIAIRMALGASSREVRRMVLSEGVRMAMIGAAVGLLAALPLPKVFEAILDGLRTGDSRTYVIMPAAILLVAVLATYIPARRASAIDPVKALRSE